MKALAVIGALSLVSFGLVLGWVGLVYARDAVTKWWRRGE